MNTNTTSEQPVPDKTPYQSPEIADHGTIEAVTQGVGIGSVDGQTGSSTP